MIVDSCVWIDHLRRVVNPTTKRLQTAMQRGGKIYLTPTILQEILQGAASADAFETLRERFAALPILETDDLRHNAETAADIYARCRRRGVTIRSAGDCLIAATAIEFSLPLLTKDAEFRDIQLIDPRLMLIG
jgi:predicted nucleic acid-binding protein